MPTPLLTITDLRVSVENKEILRGVSLKVERGEVHAIMGPNGSGKSTLANTLMGHPHYAVTGGSATFSGKDLLKMAPDERACAGLFLAFQYPRELPGIPLRSFLFAARKAQRATRGREKGMKKESPLQFAKILTERMKELGVDPAFAERSVNQGWSGGEKKKAEILQMSILEPRLALLDETDSGLDVDALRIVAEGVNRLRSKERSFVVVTHYARILAHLKPDHVHVMVGGRIVESGGPELAGKLEKGGYAKYEAKGGAKTLRLEMT